jgi:anti-sigma28 factor (negative regulator of flagellin synthesis)
MEGTFSKREGSSKKCSNMSERRLRRRRISELKHDIKKNGYNVASDLVARALLYGTIIACKQ